MKKGCLRAFWTRDLKFEAYNVSQFYFSIINKFSLMRTKLQKMHLNVSSRVSISNE